MSIEWALPCSSPCLSAAGMPCLPFVQWNHIHTLPTSFRLLLCAEPQFWGATADSEVWANLPSSPPPPAWGHGYWAGIRAWSWAEAAGSSVTINLGPRPEICPQQGLGRQETPSESCQSLEMPGRAIFLHLLWLGVLALPFVTSLVMVPSLWLDPHIPKTVWKPQV